MTEHLDPTPGDQDLEEVIAAKWDALSEKAKESAILLTGAFLSQVEVDGGLAEVDSFMSDPGNTLGFDTGFLKIHKISTEELVESGLVEVKYRWEVAKEFIDGYAGENDLSIPYYNSVRIYERYLKGLSSQDELAAGYVFAKGVKNFINRKCVGQKFGRTVCLGF